MAEEELFAQSSSLLLPILVEPRVEADGAVALALVVPRVSATFIDAPQSFLAPLFCLPCPLLIPHSHQAATFSLSYTAWMSPGDAAWRR